MTDLALQVAGSKLAISIVLGAAVWLAARGSERPRLCHALCLTLLAALLIPPLIGLPVLQPEPLASVPADVASRDLVSPVAVAIGDAQPATVGGAVDRGWFAEYGASSLVLLWLVGVVAVLGWTVARTRSFRRLLEGASREAPAQLQENGWRDRPQLGPRESSGAPHDGRARLSHGVLERGRRPGPHPIRPPRGPEPDRTALHPGT